jgi:hypothetical protein
MDPRALHLLTKATVLKSESRRGFHQLVHEYMLLFAPRNPVEEDAVEEICSASWRLYRLRAVERKATELECATQTSPDDLRCLVLASGELAGKNRRLHLFLQRHEPRLQNVIRRSFARLQALRQFSEKKGFLSQDPQNAPAP